MPIPLNRDAQKWVFDYIIQESGRVMHFQGASPGGAARPVHQHDMLSKHHGRQGARIARIAIEEEEAGHRETAMELWFDAASVFAQAQHSVLDNGAEKSTLHSLSIGSYDRVRALAPYTIEHIAIPWEDGHVYANLHLLPDKRRAPCVLFIPGCDMTKELYPHPGMNHAHQRGMHILSLDGPGQGECNLNGIRLTADNYERAVKAVLDYLVTRPEVDEDAIMMLGLSFGSFWAVRSATDPRVRALAAPWASICHKRSLMEYESPRFKMLFAYLTQAPSEEALDAITDQMTSDEALAAITCPTLLTVGEYDPRSPLDEVLSLYGSMQCERELWVFDDQHHFNTVSGHVAGGFSMSWNKDIYLISLDWLADRLAGRPLRRPGEVAYIQSGAGGPYGDSVRVEQTWLASLPAASLAGAPAKEVAIERIT